MTFSEIRSELARLDEIVRALIRVITPEEVGTAIMANARERDEATVAAGKKAWEARVADGAATTVTMLGEATQIFARMADTNAPLATLVRLIDEKQRSAFIGAAVPGRVTLPDGTEIMIEAAFEPVTKAAPKTDPVSAAAE